MVVLSKQLFYEKIGKDLTCGDVHYWNQSCIKGNLYFSTAILIGILKFFLPIYIVKAVFNRKKLKDKKLLSIVKDILLEQLRSTLYGFFLGQLFMGSNCVLWKLTGKIHYYNIALVAGTIGGLALLIETKENRTLDTLIFFNQVIEAALRNLDFFNIVSVTSGRETLMFMAVSSLLMNELQNRKKDIHLTNFWFYTPLKFKQDNDESNKNLLEQKCIHEQTCLQFTLEGSKKYFLLGYGFSVIRKLIPKMLSIFKSPQKLPGILFNKDNVRFGMFIGAYVGIYRYIMCYLLKTKSVDQKYFGAVAGLVSGATYTICPNTQVLTVAITTLLQIFYHRVLKRLQIKNQLIPQQIIYMISNGLLLHNAIMSRDSCPPYYLNMLDICSSKIFWKVYQRLVLQHFLVNVDPSIKN